MSSTRLIIELDDDLAARLRTATAQSNTSMEMFAKYQQTGEAITLSAMEEWVRSWGTAHELPPPAKL